ncbi:Gfo/Idh/MocA family protein [Salibacterium aidingense]|uniref:Gfo/Idh/MocA family protein n=1 Tax=Salibacterium aidingense TaxID=384933 RepID=UPI0004115B38|nr:Gfo/Idh/MocA family oxidoreductase [Salibacterium aidingense]
MKPIKAGLIGCGFISSIYLENCRNFQSMDIVACADLNRENAERQARDFDIPRTCSVDELLADPEIDIVLNLTIPAAHAEISLKAIEAGKHVYMEKPLSISLKDGRAVLDAAAEKGVRVGGAPDTFLGGGIQTALKLIEDGWIGRPVAATAFFMSRGVEKWHPNPDFYYQPGGGPMFDMGPYYLTTLVSLLGSVKRVTGSVQTSFDVRTTPEGRSIPVEVPTHITGSLDFENGAVGTVITSFDSVGNNLPRMEIHGETGTLSVPDPNHFGGEVLVKKLGRKQFENVPLTHGWTDNSRGIGLADMAEALLEKRPHRANDQLQYHVLEIMHAFHTASEENKHITINSRIEKPAALAMQQIF